METSFLSLVLALLILNNVIPSLSTTSSNDTTDRYALLAFKNSITSDPRGILVNNWSSNTSMCYWTGVSCGTKHHRVTALNVSGFELEGKIAPHLGNLSFLQSLDISFNNFRGFIPFELSNLRHLKVINVGVNNLAGEIPLWFEAFSELQHMHLNNNTFHGKIPPSLFNISKLQTLDIGYNFLDGSIPEEIGNFSYLETINLEYNQIMGSIPNGMFNMSSLVEIIMRYNRLSGKLPNDTCNNTPKLKRIYLSANQLHGEIPANIYKCRELEDLRLSVNRFNGNIPSEIGSLTALRTLSLATNNFKGHIPKQIGNLIFLESLFLTDNNLTGQIPKQIGNLTSLKYLALASNKLTGELPQEIGNLALLEVFSVANNSLSGSIPHSLFNISTLKILYLSSNEFLGSLPSNMGISLFNLEEVSLHINRLSGPIPSSIVNASKLTLLDISSNSFSGFLPNFDNLRLLQRLWILENNLTGAEFATQELGFLSSLTNCRSLKDLVISENPLNGVLPASIGNLSTSLLSFWANDCHINGVIPSEIGNLSSLLQIYLYRNQMTGSIPTTIGKLKQLQRIFLRGNQLQGYIPVELCQMRNLGELDLSGNMLIGPIPECLGELNSLRNIYLDSNKLDSTIPSKLWNLNDLLALNLSSNNLSGQLSSVGSLKEIRYLDLSFNNLSGDIPSTIDECKSLEFLSLSNNKFGGSIPQSLEDVKSLVKLDLSNNHLSGSIPKSLKDLPFLQYFDVSYNKLEGEIPNGGCFDDFTAQSFVHNSALCGAAKFQVPPCSKNHGGSKSAGQLMKYVLPSLISAIMLVIIMLMLIRRWKQNKIPLFTDTLRGIEWRRISYVELERGTSSFSEANLLGGGGFGSVFKGTLSDGLDVAVKVFKLQLEGAIKSFDTESEILSTIRHRNLIRVIGCCSNIEFKALVLAYMPNGSLEKWLYSNNCCLDLVQRLKIAIDVGLALEYLHHGHIFPIVHCDIKPSNVLLDEDMTAHIGDFGIGKLFDEGEAMIQTRTLATIGYAAPEYGLEGTVSTNADVYSYGIILLEMFTRKKPTDDKFSGEMSLKEWVNEALQQNATSEVVDPDLLAREDQHFFAKEQCLSSVFGLAMKCLTISPSARINMIEAVATLQKIKNTFVEDTGRPQHYMVSITITDGSGY